MRNITSAGVLVKSGDKVLLCHATGQKDNRGWGLPKGRVDVGESDSQAAVRETFEECGLRISENDITPLTQVEYRSNDENGPVFKTLKIFLHDGNEDLQKTSLVCTSYFSPYWKDNKNVKIPEIDKFKWVTPDEAKTSSMKSIRKIFDLL